MTLRRRFVLAFALVAAIVAALIGAVSYSTTEHALHAEINVSLSSAVSTLVSGGTLSGTTTGTVVIGPGAARDRSGADDTVIETAQSIGADGAVRHLSGVTVGLPVGPQALALAKSATAGDRVYERVTVNGTTYQVLTQSLGGTKGAIQVGRDLDEAARILKRLAITTALVGLGVLILAGLAGALIARRITRRLTTLAAVAEKVSLTGHLDIDFALRGHDEVGRLSSSLQSMLVQLCASQEAQQRLVENAGHELRTPLTSLRTNISVLRRLSELSPSSQQRLLDDVEGETRELTNLVNELVELSTDRRSAHDREPVDLTALAERVAANFRRRSGREILVSADPKVMVLASAHALERAVSNLIENALKFDAGGQRPVVVRVATDRIDVLDHGPGFDPADAARIFDRFFRADSARSMPGSGLGLAIVAEVAGLHGGSARARLRPGGGAEIGFTLGEETLLPNSNPQAAMN